MKETETVDDGNESLTPEENQELDEMLKGLTPEQIEQINKDITEIVLPMRREYEKKRKLRMGK